VSVSVFGVRHHGPGSARSVAAALAALEPDAVLVEGPPEAEAIAALALHPGMTPPVALLAYVPGEPRRAAFWPFAVFSPEWHAVRHALAHDVTLRFIDLPAVHMLAWPQRGDDGEDHEDEGLEGDDGPDGEERLAPLARRDPLGLLARAGGYADPEGWWEDVVEHRGAGGEDHAGVFAAVADAMAAVRAEAGELSPREARREAAMRGAIRRAMKDGHERIAVVCGAYHAPGLDPATFPTQTSDTALLKGLAKVKVAMTWVPWTHDRLAFASGYGAGVSSPGWYHHLYTAPDEPIVRWMVRVARLLRDEDLDASPASAVEAARAAQALAAIRGRPLPGLPEVDDAALAVLCGGSELPLALIARRLVVGEVLGAVPEGTPMVPLARDLADQQRTTRMKPQASVDTRELDLRKPLDLQRSRLLHRLGLLGVPWGAPAYAAGRSTGTFKESWRLEWQPEFAVRLIESGRYGTTVERAATGRVLARAGEAADLAALAPLIEGSLLAALPDAVAGLMRAFAARAANVADVASLMDALVPLARVRRYGSVRRDDVETVGAVVDGLVARICVGLSGACATLDDDGAREMVGRIDAVHTALATLDREDLRAGWLAAIGGLAQRTGLHGLVAGRACRLLHDAGELDAEEVRRRLGLALSRGGDPADGAAWLEGFLESSGLVLIHDPGLLAVIDGWVAAVGGDTFDALAPLLRRTFSTFATGERRQLGGLVKRGGGGRRTGAASAGDDELDVARAEAAVPVLALLLGVSVDG
jgi:hypothetical protein